MSFNDVSAIANLSLIKQYSSLNCSYRKVLCSKRAIQKLKIFHIKIEILNIIKIYLWKSDDDSIVWLWDNSRTTTRIWR